MHDLPCDWRSGFVMDPAKKQRVGYLVHFTGLNMSDYLHQDVTVFTPYNNSETGYTRRHDRRRDEEGHRGRRHRALLVRRRRRRSDLHQRLHLGARTPEIIKAKMTRARSTRPS